MLKRLTQTIWSGEAVDMETKADVQALMGDEKYRTYVLVKLLSESYELQLELNSHIPDVVCCFALLFF